MENVVARRAETPIEGYLACFKFYDSKHRRLSIFGKVIDDKLIITVLTLSLTPEVKISKTEIRSRETKRPKKIVQTQEWSYDQFSKKEGRKKYEVECKDPFCDTCPGNSFSVDIIENRPRYTFLKWCNTHYYRQQKVETVLTKIVYIKGSKYTPKEQSAVA